jgi:hypothetical protein
MQNSPLRLMLVLVALILAIACGKPQVESLRDSFAQQMAANKFVKDVQHNGDEVTFSGPGADGGTARWRIHIDEALIEPNDDPAQPFKGVVKSSWYSDDKPVRPSGSESNLPIELTSNGLAQDCYAFWDKATEKWSWE